MSDIPPQRAPAEQRRPLHAVIYYWGMAILLIGMAGATLIYIFAADAGDTDAASEIASSRMYEHTVQLGGGKFGLLAAQFNQWFAGLLHGRPLAGTVAVLAVAIALACFWVAHLMSAPLPREPDRERKG